MTRKSVYRTAKQLPTSDQSLDQQKTLVAPGIGAFREHHHTTPCPLTTLARCMSAASDICVSLPFALRLQDWHEPHQDHCQDREHGGPGELQGDHGVSRWCAAQQRERRKLCGPRKDVPGAEDAAQGKYLAKVYCTKERTV